MKERLAGGAPNTSLGMTPVNIQSNYIIAEGCRVQIYCLGVIVKEGLTGLAACQSFF